MKKFIAVFAVLSMVVSASPALASGWHHSSSDIEVENDNGAVVINNVESGANTGNNYAGGADGGNGGNGGNIRNGDDDVEDSTTGNGGNGGNAGAASGGLVMTGDAGSEAGVLNVVNSNATSVRTSCGCRGEIEVENDNHALVVNHVGSGANTGDNEAKGADGGSGGNGGNINNNDGEEVEDSDTGNGGNGGTAGEGGLVDTGSAYSRAGSVTIVNTNLTRVRR